ncbi:MAG: DNA topoisomerase I, partial [Proteobacteria bacterium]
MPKTLVIVESPTKAKTIEKFLGKDFDVKASYGHVRDLPNSAAEIPPDVKKHAWSRLGVNVESDFEPIYVVPEEKKKRVSDLKKSVKDADEILLATDEDREGESISWHLIEVLKPKIPVKRLVFHEITKEAIDQSLK